MFRFEKNGLVVALVATAGLLLTACSSEGGQGGAALTQTAPPIDASSSAPPATGAGTTTTPPSTPVNLASFCNVLEDVPGYVAGLPGPTRTAPGLPMTNATTVELVTPATQSAIMTDAQKSPVGQAYWNMIDVRQIVQSEQTLSTYDSSAFVKLYRKDPALRKQHCLALATELKNATTTAALKTLKSPRQLGFYVYNNAGSKSFWMCDKSVPADGVTLLEWNRTFREEQDDPIAGDTVLVDFTRRVIVTTTCPADVVEGNLDDEPEPAASPSASESNKAAAGAAAGKAAQEGTKTTTRKPSGSTPSKAAKKKTAVKKGGKKKGGGGSGGTDAGACSAGCGTGGGGSTDIGGDTGVGCTSGCGGSSSPEPEKSPTPESTPPPSSKPTPKPTPTPTPTPTPKPTPKPTPTPTPTSTPTPTPTCPPGEVLINVPGIGLVCKAPEGGGGGGNL